MNALVYAFLIAGLTEPKPLTRVTEHSTPTGSVGTTIVAVIADGSRSWSGAESDAIVEQLRREIGSKRSVYVARFDAENGQETELILAGSNRDIVHIRPRTTLMEAIALTLDSVAVGQPVSAIVLIAHAQTSPTYIRTDQIIASLRGSEVPVYTIHLSGQKQRGNLFGRLGRALLSGTIWTVETLIEEDPGEAYSADDTARMLRAMSDESGGLSCVAADRSAALGCAQRIATRITEVADPPKADSGPTP